LVRTGIGRFNIADLDEFELANTNRQYGASVPHLGCSKIDVMGEQAKSINPFLQINKFSSGINPGNVGEFLTDVDLVVDSIDAFEFDTRRLIFNEARRRGIPVVTAGPLGFSTALLVFDPAGAMGFDEYFNITDKDPAMQKLASFVVGLSPNLGFTKYMAPVNARKRKAASLGLACQLCAGAAAAEVVRILLKRGKVYSVPHYARFDPYTRRYYRGYMPLGNKNPWQRLKISLVRKKFGGSEVKFAEDVPVCPEVIASGESLSDEIVSYLVNAGRMAPSGDNVQPWNFSKDGETLLLKPNLAADTSPYNSGQRATLISFGAVAENIILAAAHVGLEAKLAFEPGTSSDDFLLRFTFAVSTEKPGLPLEVIWDRMTNRGLYLQRPLLSSTERLITDIAGDIPGAKNYFLTAPEEFLKLKALHAQADRMRIENRQAHEFFYSTLRWSLDEGETSYTGLLVSSLGVGRAGQVGLRLLKDWKIASVLNKCGGTFAVSHAASRPIVHSSAIGLLTMPTTSSEDLLRGGQALQRIWLKATELGLSFQPLAAIPITSFMDADEFSALAPGKEAAFQALQQKFQLLFPQVNWSAQRAIMLYRIGYGPAMTMRSPRRSVADFLR
ncbi:MAG: ThiF family adenylyltransferase, partial [bacterium]|nr:ThiF family adenylyltransferase [bacterium]